MRASRDPLVDLLHRFSHTVWLCIQRRENRLLLLLQFRNSVLRGPFLCMVCRVLVVCRRSVDK